MIATIQQSAATEARTHERTQPFLGILISVVLGGACWVALFALLGTLL